ncbi:MAG: hypothetical protein KY467_01215 [Gemmatimonadetes bacterium]|nr:hypothetical protein [Gemmatimonadota bacterium]
MGLLIIAAQAGAQQPVISSETALSLVTVVVLIGAAWRLSWYLSRIDSRTEALPERMLAVEKQVTEALRGQASMRAELRTMEDDINNLWSAFRQDSPERVRGERPPRRQADRS